MDNNVMLYMDMSTVEVYITAMEKIRSVSLAEHGDRDGTEVLLPYVKGAFF